jgi:PhnB protein
MSTALHPYLSFDGNAKEVMEFYKTVFGGTLDITHYEQYHMAHTEADNKRVMHSVLTGENNISFMASDVPAGTPYNAGTNVSMSLSGDNEEVLKGFWEKLSEGAQISMPLAKSPWEDQFGMLTDKFGIVWMVNIAAKKVG